MEDLVQTVATDLRGISHALMPSAIVDFGLVTALQNLCMKANASEKVAVDFYHSGIKERLDSNMELGLYRITQELLKLTVEDDGVGFEPKKLQELVDKGIGLQNIQTRVETLGGTVDIETQLGQGVMTTVEVPLQN